jgi:hypothetical protein
VPSAPANYFSNTLERVCRAHHSGILEELRLIV